METGDCHCVLLKVIGEGGLRTVCTKPLPAVHGPASVPCTL